MDERHVCLHGQLEKSGTDLYVTRAEQDIFYHTRGWFRTGYLLCPRDGPPVLVGHPGLSLIDDDAFPFTFAAERRSHRMLPRLVEEIKSRGWKPGRLAVSGLGAPESAELMRGCGAVEVRDAPEIGWLSRRKKSREELDLLRRAASIAVDAAESAVASLKEGDREIDASLRAERRAADLGAEGAWFSPRVAAGERCYNPDLEPSNRSFKTGDIGYLDVGPLYRGYAGDCTRIVSIGKVSSEAQRLMDAVHRAHDAARVLLRTGVSAQMIYRTALAALAEAGLDRHFPHHAGHALGVLGGEPPRFVEGVEESLEEGDIVTLEPGVYVSGVGGARWEDTYVIREEGPECISVKERSAG